jgi:hypothetical protein
MWQRKGRTGDTMANKRFGIKTMQFVFMMILVCGPGAKATWACRSLSKQQTMSPDEQIRRASGIAIATVVSAGPAAGGYTYEFVVQRQLAGSAPPTFTVSGVDRASNETSYDRHADPRFWLPGGGRLSFDTACVFHPSFVVGNTYLAFFGETLTKRSFERIETPGGALDAEDKWLQYVEASVITQAREKQH